MGVFSTEALHQEVCKSVLNTLDLSKQSPRPLLPAAPREAIGQANIGQGNGFPRDGSFGADESAVPVEHPSSRFRSHSLTRHSLALDVFAGVPSASYGCHVASNAVERYNRRTNDTVIAGFAYDYDAAGNRTGVLESGGDRVTYDLANQLVTSQDANGVTTYTYDLAGNLHVVQQPTGARTTSTWDDQNRQTGVLVPDGSAVTNTFRFDGLRYSKLEPQATQIQWSIM